MSKPLSRQVTFARLLFHLSGEEPATKKAAGPAAFGKQTILDEGGHVKASMLPEEFQQILTTKTSMAPCAAQRKCAVFVKRPALSSTPSPSSNPGKKPSLLISAHGQGTAHAPQTPLAPLAGMALFVSEATPPYGRIKEAFLRTKQWWGTPGAAGLGQNQRTFGSVSRFPIAHVNPEVRPAGIRRLPAARVCGYGGCAHCGLSLCRTPPEAKSALFSTIDNRPVDNWQPAWAANASTLTVAGALPAWAAQVATAARSTSRDRPGWVAKTVAVATAKAATVVPAAAGTTATAGAVAIGTADPGALWDRRPTSPTT